MTFNHDHRSAFAEMTSEESHAFRRLIHCEGCKPDALVLLRHFEARTLEVKRTRAQRTQIEHELSHVRRKAANLIAAMRAALGAASDGEPDPLWYIRDEVEEHENQSSSQERRWCV